MYVTFQNTFTWWLIYNTFLLSIGLRHNLLYMPVINFSCHLLTFTLHETNLKTDIECLIDKLKVY